jgi:glutamyl/glutaminyl-tRNA synthetase
VKLDWMNGEYIKRLPIEELHTRIAEHLEKYEREFYASTFSKAEYVFNTRILRELQTRMKRFDEYIELTKFLYSDSALRSDLLINPKMKIESLSDAKESLLLGQSVIMACDDLDDMEAFKSTMIIAIQQAGKKNGQVLWPIRVALSGEEFSPGAFELAHILGKAESLRRIQRMIENI